MQKKIYLGGLPWELDRVGILNYIKAVMEGAGMEAGYEPPFVNPPVTNPNSSIRVIDVFVAMDQQTGKSRGFGFVTVDFAENVDAEEMFAKIIALLSGKVLVGIRGARELIANEAAPREEGADRAPRQDFGAPRADEADASADMAA